jgi:O-acetylhomoserine/O-acetylserine sulfhydrylase-like pyridoxal-dependent enzyme
MNDLYGGTNRFFRRVVMDKHKIDVTFVEATDPKEVEKAMRPNTKMVRDTDMPLTLTVKKLRLAAGRWRY